MAAVLGASFQAELKANLAQCWWEGCPWLGPHTPTLLLFRFVCFPPSPVAAARAGIGAGPRGARGAWSAAPELGMSSGASQGVNPPYTGASAAPLPAQLKSSDFAVLKRLVPLLEELSRTYPEPLTQELASDLRIAICTHGACAPGSVGAAADGVLGRKRGTAARSPAGTAPGPPAPRHARGSPSAHRESGKERCREPGASPAPAGLQELLLAAYDPQPPSRAAALRRLASLVTQRDPEAIRLQEKLLQVPGSCCGPCPCPLLCPPLAELALNRPSAWGWSRLLESSGLAGPAQGHCRWHFPSFQVFLENVQHEDAFVYLSAIQGEPVGVSASPLSGKVLCCGGSAPWEGRAGEPWPG